MRPQISILTGLINIKSIEILAFLLQHKLGKIANFAV